VTNSLQLGGLYLLMAVMLVLRRRGTMALPGLLTK